VMQTFASNLLDHRPILVTQLKSSLLHEHTPVREAATDVLYSCFDIYVSPY
jgi:pyruvate kinase